MILKLFFDMYIRVVFVQKILEFFGSQMLRSGRFVEKVGK